MKLRLVREDIFRAEIEKNKTESPSFDGKTCQETKDMIGNAYVVCGAPAVMLVRHRGRTEGPYYMCEFDGWHNTHNRNAELLAEKDPVCEERLRILQQQEKSSCGS